MQSTMITVAGTGGEILLENVPHLPTQPDEIASMAQASQLAGAAMVHIHVRDKDGLPTLDLHRIHETVSAVRERSDLVVQLSTGGSITDPFDKRIEVLSARPESCSITLGTVNFGSGVFMNPWGFIVELYQEAKRQEVVPEFEVFELGHLTTLQRLLDQEGLPFSDKVHCDLVLGVPGAAAGAPALVHAAQGFLPPEVTSWSATGIGRSAIPVMLSALAMGGHLRVGMEDTVTFAKGEPVKSNEQLVQRAADLAELSQRPAMTPETARLLLGTRKI